MSRPDITIILTIDEQAALELLIGDYLHEKDLAGVTDNDVYRALVSLRQKILAADNL